MSKGCLPSKRVKPGLEKSSSKVKVRFCSKCKKTGHNTCTCKDPLHDVQVDDLSFKLEYVHPYLNDIHNHRNWKKPSPIFTGGPGWMKFQQYGLIEWASKLISKSASPDNANLLNGLVMEEITMCDETGSICTNWH